MRWGRVAAILLRQLYLMRGSPARILPLFAWVAVDIVLWGFITRWLDAVAGARASFVPALLGRCSSGISSAGSCRA
jgi:ABC-2 type transport system permease protein